MHIFWIIFGVICAIIFGLLMWALCAVGKRGDKYYSKGEDERE